MRAFIICAAIFDTMRSIRDGTASVMQCYAMLCNVMQCYSTHLTSTATGNHCTASLFLVRPKDFACTTYTIYR